MALLWADGFDHWGNNAAMFDCYTATGYGIVTSNPRTGSSCLEMYSGSTLRRVLGVAENDVYAGLAVRMQDVREHVLMRFEGSNVELRSNTNYGFSLFDGNTLIAVSTSNIWALGGWNYIEGHVCITAGNRVVEFRLNGAPIFVALNPAWLDLVPTNAFVIVTGGGGTYIDDLYVCNGSGTRNNTFLGERRMRLLLPVADDTPQDWTPTGGGSGFSQVDNVPANNAQYVSADTVGERSVFGLGPDLPVNTSNVAALVVFQRSIKSDNGAASIRAGVVDPAGTKTGTVYNPLDTNAKYAINPDIFETDSQGNPYSRTSVDASKVVIDRTA